MMVDKIAIKLSRHLSDLVGELRCMVKISLKATAFRSVDSTSKKRKRTSLYLQGRCIKHSQGAHAVNHKIVFRMITILVGKAAR